MSLSIRRTLVWALSAAIGLLGTVGILAAFSTTLPRYSYGNALLTFLSIAALAFIWLDYGLRAEYLRS
jgi:hypothetical protein